jgi:hypothetical protein
MRRCSITPGVVYCAALLLCLAGAAKVYSFLVEPMWASKRPDPVLAVVSQDRLLFAAGLLELAGGVLVAFGRMSARSKGVLLLWVASLILLYRLGLWMVGTVEPCHCMGVMPRLLRLRASSVDAIMLSVAMFVWIAGLAALFPSRGRFSEPPAH